MDVLSEDFYAARERDLQKRLKPSRFTHVQGVAQTAQELAHIYGVDERKAHLAGLLHDWDKNYNDEEIRARALDLGLDVDDYVLEKLPALLHGPTAAAALGREWPEIPADVLQAISRHTTGAVDMSDLDMVLYVADAIEPSRIYGDLDELRDLVGKVELEELFFRTFQHVFLMLVGRGKCMDPQTAVIWNHYVARARERAGKGGEA